jgi:hypothetical protein
LEETGVPGEKPEKEKKTTIKTFKKDLKHQNKNKYC